MQIGGKHRLITTTLRFIAQIYQLYIYIYCTSRVHTKHDYYIYLYTYSMLSLHRDNKGFGDDDKLPCHFDYDLEGVSDEIGMLSVI